LLQEKQLAHVATVLADGSPQVTPVWVDVEQDGSHLFINTSLGRLKERNLIREPRVALSVVDSQNPFRAVAIRGRVVERRGPSEGADEHIDRLAKKYLGVDKYPNRRPGEDRVTLRIKPEWILERGVS
jgi:PPOX class probable F420-dependent enzyme